MLKGLFKSSPLTIFAEQLQQYENFSNHFNLRYFRLAYLCYIRLIGGNHQKELKINLYCLIGQARGLCFVKPPQLE